MTYEELKESVRGLSGEEAVKVLSDYLTTHPENDDALTLRGLKYWGMQKRAQAINDYLAAIRINPASPSVQALKVANEILDYYNKDLYNP